MKKILFLFAVLLSFSSCTNTVSDNSEDLPYNIICFIDFSETPDWEDRMNSMKVIIQNSVINKLGYNAKLIILPLDKGSITGSKEILIGTTRDEFDYIPDMTAPPDEEKVARENLQKTRDSLINVFNTAFSVTSKERKSLQKGTDIFGAIDQAGQYITKGKNLIIFFSDMMNWSNDLKMEPGNFTLSAIEDKLAKSPALTLPESSIYVLTGNVSHIDADHFKAVKQFWEKYFQKQQIVLLDFSSGNVTQLEKLITNQ